MTSTRACVCAQIVVNAIVDTLKTAFPRPDAQSPTEDEAEVDGLKAGSEKKSRYHSWTLGPPRGASC